jgi:hypothetical protein
MADLEPDVLLGERARRVIHNVLEALQIEKELAIQAPRSRDQWLTYIKTLAEFLLLLVYYAQTEVDLIGLFKLRRHAHDLRKGLFGVVQGSIAIVQDTNTVPELGFLYWNGESVSGL